MKLRVQTAVWVLVLVACGVGPMVAWRAASLAARERAEAEERHARVAELVADVERLRAFGRARGQSGAVGDALAAKVASALTARGLPAGAMTGLNPQTESIGGKPGVPVLLHHRASLVLSMLTLAQCGAFLEEFRRREPGWTVTAIELSPDAAGKVVPGADLPLRAQLTLESVTAPGSASSSLLGSAS